MQKEMSCGPPMGRSCSLEMGDGVYHRAAVEIPLQDQAGVPIPAGRRPGSSHSFDTTQLRC